ncbi:Polyphosphatidylinositol phosphatase INP52 [Wickerhamiella sorbophila]|uniref:Polyphosphatidylinositol phosphatase INP52 n=1 Tax=Wickerhamiella sorbophila TaxID=45607 RepID=A0A2T0FHF6_9ASCO|nr:Polyphosphatidylinositol phosphatase INP52 [Wickerhamiella sorbophila]PRT54415.1 Polyphosphatidylinositol phosphatase INP52 [Wickerhamiella sorbophila]
MDVAILTLNCAKSKQSLKKFAKLVTESLPAESPGLFVVGLQEVAPIIAASFKDLNAYMEPIRRAIVSALAKKYSGVQFSLVADSWSGAIGVMVYAQRSRTIRDVKTASTTFGRFWSSVKSAAAVRLEVDSTTFTFVTTHLAANEGYAQDRNRDYAILANGLRFKGEPMYVYGPNHHLFVFGDLNYRSLRQQGDGGSEAIGMLVSNYDPAIDELHIEKAAGNTLWGLTEAPINFEPTFKFVLGTSDYDLKRTPSWCDRILYSDVNSHVSEYSSVPDYLESDHKPVYLHVTVSESAPLQVRVPSAPYVTKNFSDASDKVVGSALYLGTTKVGWFILVLLVLLGLYMVT